MTVAAIFHRPPAGPDADRDLLRRFADRRDDGAFAALVRRYGRLVFATCLRVLSHRADAEDAYQATFLVLARRCGAIRSDEKLAGWLHTVAVRTATEVRRMRDRRRRAEATPSLTLPAPTDPLESRELAAVLDEELAKLPDHYRLAVVLCELNGVGRKAAAKELGVAEGTLSSRLAKARKLLADRLTGRGFGAVSAGALTAALANSAVARIPATALDFGTASYILNITIQSVADTVVKAMFATKLKAGAVAAVLLALAGGVVWTTAAGAGPGEQPAPAKEKADPAEPLVAQLGSKDFAEREAAEKSLREMGAAAFAAVTAGLKSDNPEVVKRCQKLLGQFRKDDLDKFVAAFKKDADFKLPFDHPVWNRWADVIGTTRGCRELFDEMLLVPDAADLLDELDKKPERAKDVYKEQLLKWNALVEKRCRAHSDPNEWLSSNMGYSTGERTFLAYLATFHGTENVFGTESSEIECNPIGGLPEVHFRMPGPVDTSGPMGQPRLTSVRVGTEAQKWRAHRIESPAKWLYLKVLTARKHPHTLTYLLQHAGSLKAEDRASLARTIFGDQSLPVRTRVYTLGTLVDIDAVDLLPALAKLRDDATEFERFIDGTPEVEYRLQVRDKAVATMLLLHKQDLRQFGFPKMIAEGIADFQQNNTVAQSFPDDASRKAMHEKATAFLAKAGKPEKRKEVIDPAIQSLIEQLGDKRLAKRDEAEKALIAVGEKARLALFNGWGRANPEIAERCERLFHQLNDAKKKGVPKKADPAPALVARLGGKDFADREAAEKALRELGAAALPAVESGMKSDNPEIVRRCRKLVAAIRKDIREAFAAAVLADKEQTKAFDHPIWKRYVALAGDSKASRVVFAELLKYKHPDGLEVLDAADRDPAKADELYREHLVGLAKQVEPLMKNSFSIRDMLPGHTTDIAAYTLFLGSIRTTATPPDKLQGAESYRYVNGRNYVLRFGEGLKAGLAGKLIVQGTDMKAGKLGRVTTPGEPGTDAVFARLYAACLAIDSLPAEMVAELGSKEFAEREAAEKTLKEMGAAAFAAVTAGQKSDNPEVVARCRKLLPAIRKAVTIRFAEAFLADKDRTKAFDHPVWKRFASITGDSKASRAIFAEVLSYDYPNGLLALDDVERQPERAVALFTESLCDLLKDYDPLDAKNVRSGIRPTDLIPHADTRFAAYTLFLGSYRSSAAAPAALSQADSLRYTNAWSGAVNGQGLLLGLTGKFAVGQPDTKPGLAAPPATTPGPAGTDAALARLYLQFLASERPDAMRGYYYGGWDWATPSLFEPNELPNRERSRLPLPLHKLALPVARRMVADATAHPSTRAFWIPLLYRFGDRTDAIRLTGLFADATPLVIRQGGNLSVQVREWAVGTALLLRGQNPAKFGFDRFDKPPEREFDLPDYPLYMFAVREPGTGKYATDIKERDPAAKEKVLKAAIEWLDEEARKEKEPPKKDDPAPALVAQLGSKEFAEREAAEKSLRELGAAAFAAVSNGQKSDNPEIVRRCQKLMPTLRAAHLARPESEVWKRFTAITGDTPHARELFLDMAGESTRVDLLTDGKPGDAYRRFVEGGNAALRAGYEQAEREARGRTGVLRPASGLPTRGDAALLFFLGSHAETGNARPDVGGKDRWTFPNFLGEALAAGRPGEKAAFPPEVRKLFAAWLAARQDAESIRVGLSFARYHQFAEALPVARAMLANDRMTLAERTPALFVIATSGTKADLDRVRPFLDSDAEYHRTKYTDEGKKQYPVVTQVRDVAHAVAGKLLGAEPIDVGFEFCELYKTRGAAAFMDDYKLGFTSDEKRTAAHANVRKLLTNAPVPKDFGPPKRPKLPKAAPPSVELRAELTGPSVLCTEKMVGELEARATELAKRFPAAEDRARIALHTGRAIANGRLWEDHARVKAFAERASELSRDPETRWKPRSLQASAIYLSGVKFDEGRRKQAEVLLAGYVELLAQDLPDADPEWPAMRKLRLPDAGPDADPVERAAILAERDAQDKARADAEFVKEQVFGRKVLLMQLRDAYKPFPNDPRRTADGPDELRALAAKTMTEREVSTLMKRVLEEK